MRVAFPIVVCLAAVAASAAPARAQDAEVLALARSMAYDRKLEHRCGERLDLWVVYAADDRASERQAERVAAGLGNLSFTVGGLALNVQAAPVDEDLWPSLADADALFVASGLEDSLPDLLAAAREHDALSLSLEPDYPELGVSLSLVEQSSGKYRVVVNLRSSRAEGVVFSPALLELADVIR